MKNFALKLDAHAVCDPGQAARTVPCPLGLVAPLQPLDSFFDGVLAEPGPFKLVEASTPALKLAAYRMRWEAILEMGVPASNFPERIDVDEYDAMSDTFTVLALAGRKVVGMARLVFPNSDCELPTTKLNGCADISERRFVDLNRLIIAKPHRTNKRLFALLFAGAWKRAYGKGFHAFLGADTVAMLRMYRKMGIKGVKLANQPTVHYNTPRYPVRFNAHDIDVARFRRWLGEG